MIKKSFSKLIRDEMVKRFESVVQDQIKENELRFLALSKQLDEIKQSISSLKKESDHTSKYLSFFEKGVRDQHEIDKFLARKDFEDQSSYIRDQSKSLHSFYEKIEERLANLAGLADLEKTNHEMSNRFKQVHEHLESEVSKALDMIYNLDCCCESREVKNVTHVEDLRKIVNQSKEDINNNIKDFLVEQEGFKRECEILKKRVFISEKKIENLYTLIDRAKK